MNLGWMVSFTNMILLYNIGEFWLIFQIFSADISKQLFT